MTRAQFLNELYRRLPGLTQEQAEQHLTYYAEMLADRMEEGMSEEEAVASMEPLDVIAQRILQDEGVPEGPPQPPQYPDLPGTDGSRFTKAPDMPRKRERLVQAVLWAVAAIAVISAVGRWSARRYSADSSEPTVVDHGIAREYADDWAEVVEDWAEYAEDWADEVGTDWVEFLYGDLGDPWSLDITPDGVYGSCFSLVPGSIFVQNGVHDIQIGPDGVDMGGALGIGADSAAAARYRYRYEDDIYRLDVGEAQNISVEWNTGVVQIQGWDEEYIQFQEFSDTKLKQPQKLEYSVDGDMLYINKDSGLNKCLVVWVPTYLLDYLSVETSTADIYYNQLAAGQGTAHATTGKIFVSNAAFNRLDAESSSGSVLLCCVAATSAEADATSGGIYLNAVAAAELDASTSSGNIFGLAVGGSVDLDTTSGRINVNTAGGALGLETTSGAVTATLPSIVPPAYVDVETTSGDIILCLPEQTGFALEFDSSAGDFDRGPFSVVRSGDAYITDNGTIDLQLEVSTSSGDLRLDTIG